ncbi:MAG: hypothetical protein AAB408_04805 [Patescibacteria group bacterium]
MRKNGWALGVDMLVFDEKTGHWQWNEKYVELLNEEVGEIIK